MKAVRRPVASKMGRVFRDALDRLSLRGAEDRPVFLGGCPRSGTTLLRTMLHSHPMLAVPRETRFVLDSFRRRNEFGDLRDPANRAKLADWIVGERTTRFHRLKLDPEKARERLAEAPPTLGSVVGTGLAMYAERHGAARWGDKRPLNIDNLPAIFAMFPDVQFISIVRDPRAVVASMKKLGWIDDWYNGSVAGGVDRWVRAVLAGRWAASRYRRDQYLELRYEDLVADPERALLSICHFTGLSTEHLNAMLLYHESAAEIPQKLRQKYHPLLAQPITTEAATSWTTQLEQEEVAFIEHVAARQMRMYGYEPSVSGVVIPSVLADAWARAKRRRRLHRTTGIGSRRKIAARLTSAQRRRARLLLN